MKIKSRLEIYPGSDIKGRAIIVGERAALKELAAALLVAADSNTGFRSINLYHANGHDYEILVTKNIEESEWQDLPANAKQLRFVDELDSVKKTLSN